MRVSPEELMGSHGLNDEDLITHWEAHSSFSSSGSDKKIKAIKEEIRNKFSKFYKACRANGYFPKGPSDGRMEWFTGIGRQEAYRQWLLAEANNPRRPEKAETIQQYRGFNMKQIMDQIMGRGKE